MRDDVPWDRLWVYAASETSPRDARHIPKLVRRVGQLRGSRRVRTQAMTELEWSLEHQGGLSPATVHVIPRLFEILRERPGRPWQRRAILQMLALFAVPQPGNLFPDLVDPGRDYVDLDPRCFHATADREVARACFLAVEDGAPALLSMFEDPSDRVACEAIGLLSLFRRHAALTIGALASTRPATRACAVVARARLGDVVEDGGDYADACALAIRHDNVQAAVLHHLATPPAHDEAPFGFGWSWSSIGLTCLARQRDTALIVDVLVERLRVRPDHEVLHHLVDRAPRDPRVLAAIRDHADFEDAQQRDAVRITGAPTESRDGFSAWLAALGGGA